MTIYTLTTAKLPRINCAKIVCAMNREMKGDTVGLHVTQIVEVALYLRRIVPLRDIWRKEWKLTLMSQTHGHRTDAIESDRMMKNLD